MWSNQAIEAAEAKANAVAISRAMRADLVVDRHRSPGPSYEAISDLLALLSDMQIVDMCNAHVEMYSVTVAVALGRNCADDLAAQWLAVARCCLPPDVAADSNLMFSDGSRVNPLPYCDEIAGITAALADSGDPAARREALFSILSHIDSQRLVDVKHVFQRRSGSELMDAVRAATSHGYQVLLLAMLSRTPDADNRAALAESKAAARGRSVDERAYRTAAALRKALLADGDRGGGRLTYHRDAGYVWAVEFFVNKPAQFVQTVAAAIAATATCLHHPSHVDTFFDSSIVFREWERLTEFSIPVGIG